MQLLPSELKCLIVELCSCSPNSLAALARTHAAYQREAEKALYDTICIYASSNSNNSLKCMETLAKNPKKAAFVRSLTLEYAWDKINRNRRITNYLLKSLINMDSLSDFRVRSGPNKAETQMMKSLGKIVWSVCEILILHETNDAADNTVKVIFDYKLFTATTFSTFLKSLRVNPIWRYLDFMAMPVRAPP